MSAAWQTIDDLFNYKVDYTADEHTDGEAYLTMGYNPPRTGHFIHPSHEDAKPYNPQIMSSGFMTAKSLKEGYSSYRKEAARETQAYFAALSRKTPVQAPPRIKQPSPPPSNRVPRAARDAYDPANSPPPSQRFKSHLDFLVSLDKASGRRF